MCKTAGYNRIAIGVRDNRIYVCRRWPFGFEGNAFASPDVNDKTGWPAIWGISEKCGVHGGCGNGQQVQIKDDVLTHGKYDLSHRFLSAENGKAI